MKIRKKHKIFEHRFFAACAGFSNCMNQRQAYESEKSYEKKKIFDDSTFREPSQFERVENEIINQNQKILNSNIAHIFHRADPASRRRDRPKGSERARNENEKIKNENDRNDRDKKNRKYKTEIINN